jgi:hypothetical protein
MRLDHLPLQRRHDLAMRAFDDELVESSFAFPHGQGPKLSLQFKDVFVNLRVPYPIGFFTKWAKGRIDDAHAGWKGRALWTTYSTRTMFHLEGGKENRPKVVRFQLRPNPLAR